MVLRWPDWPGPMLAISGQAGSGKTHLGAIWQKRSQAVELDLRDFRAQIRARSQTYERAAAPRGAFLLHASPSWIHSLETELFLQEELFHFLNEIAAPRGFYSRGFYACLVLSEVPPASWRVGLADLRTRLRALPVFSLTTPDDETLALLLRRHFQSEGLDVEENVLAYLVLRVERRYDFVRLLVRRINQMSLALRRRVTIPLARTALLQVTDVWPSDDGGEVEAGAGAEAEARLYPEASVSTPPVSTHSGRAG